MLLGFIFRLLQDAQEGGETPDIIPGYQVSHIDMMPYMWTIVIDVSILFALFRFKAFTIYVHSIIALFVSLTTLITAMPILIDEGIPSEQDDEYEQRHFIIGLIMIILVFLQVALGIMAKILQIIRWSHPYLVYAMNTCHKYLGYGLIILGKIQVFLILKLDQERKEAFWGLIAAEAAFLFIWLACKLFYSKLQGTIIPLYKPNQISKVSSLADIERQNKFVAVFANYVYNLDPLLYNHPCGYRIIDSVKGIEMDRYLYGMYEADRFPRIPTNSHGYLSLKLLDEPIAKINIPNVYSGLQQDINQVQLSAVNSVSPKGLIYQLKLSKRQGPFVFKGYSSLNQLGRYYSLTVDNKTTRLYTTVGFLNSQNISFLSKQLQIQTSNVPSNAFSSQQNLTIRQLQNKGHQDRDISLLVKLYPNGCLTPILLRRTFKKLQLSQQRGQGLRLHEIPPGKIIIVTGGTGLYPFSDLIDLLYKNYLALTNILKRQYVYSKDPILQTNPFTGFTFHLLVAVHNIEDIHPITLRQLIQLNKRREKLRLTMRIGSQSQEFKSMNKQIEFTAEKFDTLCLKQMSRQAFSKVIICGPPAMTKALISQLDKGKVDKDKYLML